MTGKWFFIGVGWMVLMLFLLFFAEKRDRNKKKEGRMSRCVKSVLERVLCFGRGINQAESYLPKVIIDMGDKSIQVYVEELSDKTFSFLRKRFENLAQEISGWADKINCREIRNPNPGTKNGIYFYFEVKEIPLIFGKDGAILKDKIFYPLNQISFD